MWEFAAVIGLLCIAFISGYFVGANNPLWFKRKYAKVLPDLQKVLDDDKTLPESAKRKIYELLEKLQ